MLQAIKENITLENVKKSDYWSLLAIIVWNHYSEEKFQDDSAIEITEDWCGEMINNAGASYGSCWNDPQYSETGYVRALNAIVIKFTRSDYVIYIYIKLNGNINAFSICTDKEKLRKSSPKLNGTGRNMDITNWMIKNHFIEYHSS